MPGLRTSCACSRFCSEVKRSASAFSRSLRSSSMKASICSPRLSHETCGECWAFEELPIPGNPRWLSCHVLNLIELFLRWLYKLNTFIEIQQLCKPAERLNVIFPVNMAINWGTPHFQTHPKATKSLAKQSKIQSVHG